MTQAPWPAQQEDSKPRNDLLGDLGEPIIRAVAEERFEDAKHLMRKLSSGGKPTKAAFHSLIHASGGNTLAAQWFAHQMDQAGYHFNCVTYNCLLASCLKANHMELAQEWWSDMVRRGIKPSRVSYNTMMTACSRRNDPVSAEEWMLLMIREGIAPCHISYILLLDSFSRANNASGVSRWFRYLIESGTAPDYSLYRCVLQAFAKFGCVEEAERVYNHITSYANYCLDNLMVNLLLAACCNGQDARRARSWLMELLPHGYVVDSQTLQLMASTFFGEGPNCAVVLPMARFLEGGMEPTPSNYSLLLQCLSAMADPAACQQCLAQMEACGFPLSLHSFTCVLAAYVNADKIEEAQHWLDEMLRRGMLPDDSTTFMLSRAQISKARMQPVVEKVMKMILPSNLRMVYDLLELLGSWCLETSPGCVTEVLHHCFMILADNLESEHKVIMAAQIGQILLPQADIGLDGNRVVVAL
mmetsp:Transcript_34653/g.79825  ORF Transcript_34653/g.79825 Transcript_34653/m.79825 type:complete len:471 (+) Transcript_34653:74-1486(+)